MISLSTKNVWRSRFVLNILQFLPHKLNFVLPFSYSQAAFVHFERLREKRPTSLLHADIFWKNFYCFSNKCEISKFTFEKTLCYRNPLVETGLLNIIGCFKINSICITIDYNDILKNESLKTCINNVVRLTSTFSDLLW